MVESEDALTRQALLPERSRTEPRPAACSSGIQVPRRRVLQPALLALVYLAQMFGQFLEVRCQFFYSQAGSQPQIKGETGYNLAADAISDIIYSKSGAVANFKHLNTGTNRKVVLQINSVNAGVLAGTEPIYFDACSVFGGRFL